MTSNKFDGCTTALATPFDDKSRVDWEALERNVEFQAAQGVTGLLPMGSTGESATVTHQEHSRIIEEVTEYASGRAMILAGTGSNNTEEALLETRNAVDAGVDSCLLVDCYYNKPSSLELRREYYQVLLEGFPEMDFIAYAIPGRSVTVLLPEDMALLAGQHDNLAGVKEATGDFERMRRTRQLVGGDFNILSGDDPNTLRMMTDEAINACGVVSVMSNIVPAAVQDYTMMVNKGEVEAAKEIETALQPLFKVVSVTVQEELTLPSGEKSKVTYKIPNPVPVKTMMNGLGMLENLCKQPLGRLTRQGVDLVRQALLEVWENKPGYLTPIQDHFDADIEERLDDENRWKKLAY